MKKIIVLQFIIIGLFGLFLLIKNVYGEQNGHIDITAYNPYRLQTQMELKCDWNNDTEDYNFHKFIIVPAKGSILIRVPNSIHKCEIWPKILFWGK